MLGKGGIGSLTQYKQRMVRPVLYGRSWASFRSFFPLLPDLAGITTMGCKFMRLKPSLCKSY